MKKRLTILLLSLVLTNITYAQNRKERLTEAKKVFIAEQLKLSSEQATTFWPVYDEYNAKRRNLRREKVKLTIDAQKEALTDAEATAIVQQGFAIEQKELDLTKAYYIKFETILSARQLLSLAQSEKAFKKKILNELRKKQQTPGPGPGQRF